MSGETNMRLDYGGNSLGFSSRSSEYFKNYSFPLRRNEIYKRIMNSSSLQENTVVDKNIYMRYDTRLQKFTFGNVQ